MGTSHLTTAPLLRRKDHMLRTGRPLLVLASVAGCALALGASPALGQEAPTGIERAIALTNPSVVLVETRANVNVRINDLIYGKVASVRVNRSAGVGSGFIVNPTGTVVTASHVVDPEPAEMRAQAVVAAFAPDRRAAQSAAELVAIRRAELRCMEAITCQFTIRPVVQVHTGFAIGRERALSTLPARILRRTGFNSTDVAVLQVVETSLPTVPLAATSEELTQGQEIAAIGYPESAVIGGRESSLTEPRSRPGRVDNVTTQGSSRQVEIVADSERGMSGGPVVDENGEVIGLTSFLNPQSTGEAGAKVLRTVDDIRAALSDVGAQAERGAIDTAFASGMDKFWRNEFTDAQPELRTVLDLQPGHIQARNTLNVAVRNAGADGDASPSLDDDSGFPWWGIVMLTLAGVALVGGLAYLLLRRSGRLGVKAAPAAAPAAVSSQPMTERGRTVVSTRPTSAVDEPTLVIRDGLDAGQRYPITKDTLLGREDSDIVLNDEEVSRRHALVRPVNGKLEVSDLRSSNGTRVNGEPVDGVLYLADGDVIELGRTKLAVELPAASDGTAASHMREPR
jgi:S1-C subfamily serine protease